MMGENIKFILAFFLVMLIPMTATGQKVYHDSINRKVILKENPKRIISLAPSITEILYFLEAGDRIVGVTDYSYYPPDAMNKPKVGSYININMEKVLSLSPDLVIATKDGNPPQVVDALEMAKIPTYVINPRTLDEISETIARLADIVGVSANVSENISILKERIKAIMNSTDYSSPIKVFLQINIKPVMTIGRNTIHQDIIRVAGGKNIFEDMSMPYPRVSVEEVIKRAPDVIFISSMEIGGEFESAKKEWMRWDMIPAVKKGHIFMIDSDLIDRPTPRAVDGLQRIHEALKRVRQGHAGP